MQTNFLQKDDGTFYHQKSLRELLDFHTLNYVLTYMHVLFLWYCKAHIRY